MLRNKLIILPINENWNHTADFLRQTAIVLSKNNQVVIYDQKNAYFFLKKVSKIIYPNYKEITFHRVRYFLPFRRIPLIEKLNRQLSFWLFLQKYKSIDKILWIFYPNYFDLASVKNSRIIKIYDCVDYQEDKGKEKKLIRNTDYFFVNSLSLKNLHKNQIKKPIYINAQGFFIPDEKLRKKSPYQFNKPVIGFVGGINYRLDFPLLNKLIANNPQWQFVFYGPKQKYPKEDLQFQTDFWLKKIKKYKNVFFGESKNRYYVYGIIKQFDIAIIPYNIKVPFNKYCYPMKIFEYLYFDKPVISTEIKELKLKKFKAFIKIAKRNSDWKKYLQYFLEHRFSLTTAQQRKKLSIANNWNQKIEKILKIIFSD